MIVRFTLPQLQQPGSNRLQSPYEEDPLPLALLQKETNWSSRIRTDNLVIPNHAICQIDIYSIKIVINTGSGIRTHNCYCLRGSCHTIRRHQFNTTIICCIPIALSLSASAPDGSRTHISRIKSPLFYHYTTGAYFFDFRHLHFRFGFRFIIILLLYPCKKEIVLFFKQQSWICESNTCLWVTKPKFFH